MPSIPESIAIAIQHHQAGRFAMAEQIYRQILAVAPDNVDALHLLGVACYQIDQRVEALEYIQRAIQLHGNEATFYNSLGKVLRAHRKWDEAVAACRHAIALKPDYSEAFFNLANVLYDQAKPEEAVATYSRALEWKPNYYECYNNLGVTLKELGRLDEAVAAFRKVLELKPGYAEGHNQLAILLQNQGKLTDAVAEYRRALELKPDFPDALNNLGATLNKIGDYQQAVACFRRALELKSGGVDSHNGLGFAWHFLGKLDDAVSCYRTALKLKPDDAGTHNNLGVALLSQRKLEEAVACFRRALELKPDFADSHNNLGSALIEQRKFEEAVACCREALKLKPDFHDAHNNLGVALKDLGKLDEAVVSFRRALELKPDCAETHNNLGLALMDLGKLDDAIACYQRALSLKPDFAKAHANLGYVWLHIGEWERGWQSHEWRSRAKDANTGRFSQPVWDGTSLANKTILLHAEQGLGDTIHFIRFAPIIKQAGATVIVECQKPLLRLLAHCPGIDQCIGQGSELPVFDVHAPLMSLPSILKMSLENCPANVPYIHPPLALVEQWRERLSTLDGLKVGVVWQGSAKYRSDRFRSFPLRRLVLLAQLSGVRLISLQKGDGTEQLEEVREQFNVINLAAELDKQSGPFMDTAAVMKNLDLVITPNTAIAHLAGALGVPVWVALRFAPDWRWLSGRSDSPWYPTMRLFRQQEAGNWDDVFAAMKQALCERLASS